MPLRNISHFPIDLGSRDQTVDSRQLHRLFRLHDSGLDQSFIDSLPTFSFRSIVVPKTGETFDFPVCLSEFAGDDKVRLLLLFSHTFHLPCIDTWLLANSSLPLCRGSINPPGMHRWVGIVYDDRQDGGSHGNDGREVHYHAAHDGGGDSKVFSVKLGKFKRIIMMNGDRHRDDDGAIEPSSVGSESGDCRRCFSMGSIEYVVDESGLRVKLSKGDPVIGAACVQSDA